MGVIFWTVFLGDKTTKKHLATWENLDDFIKISYVKESHSLGDSNEAKIRVAEYSTILFQQGQFLSRVRPTKFKANIIAKIERY